VVDFRGAIQNGKRCATREVERVTCRCRGLGKGKVRKDAEDAFHPDHRRSGVLLLLVKGLR
jgi:hypothetical protein